MKKNEGKPQLSLVYKSFVDEVAKVRMYGLTKYPDRENWRTTQTELHHDALLRHIFAYLDGEENDSESNLNHLAHAACNIMFLIEEKKDESKFLRERD